MCAYPRPSLYPPYADDRMPAARAALARLSTSADHKDWGPGPAPARLTAKSRLRSGLQPARRYPPADHYKSDPSPRGSPLEQRAGKAMLFCW